MAQILGQPLPISAYFSGWHSETVTWARTNAAFGNPTAGGSSTLNTGQSSGLGTVTGYDSGGGAWLPGIVFTPDYSGKYEITVTVPMQCATLSAFGQAELYDVTASTSIAQNYFRAAANNGTGTVTLVGIVSCTAGAAKTVTIRTACSSGAITIQGDAAVTKVIGWCVRYVGR